MSNRKLWIMCGRAFAGKSTKAKEIARQHGAKVISLDSINLERGLVSGDGLDVSDWIRTTEIAHDRAAKILREGGSVVIDDTNSLKFLREAWRELATENQAYFEIVWIPITPEEQSRRVLENRQTQLRPDVSDDVLIAHNSSFEEPDDLELRY